MVMINLFPWREHARAYQSKMTKRMVFIAVLLAFIFLISMHYIIFLLKTDVSMRIAHLQDEMRRFSNVKKTQQESLFSLSPAQIQEVLTESTATQNLFLSLEKAQVNSICFTEMMSANDVISFSGYTRSVTDFIEFLNQFSVAGFSEIKIDRLRQHQKQVFEFRFLATRRSSSRSFVNIKNP